MKFKLFSVPTIFIFIIAIILFTKFDILDWLIAIFCGIFVAVIIAIIKLFSWIKSHIAPQNHNGNFLRNNERESKYPNIFDDDYDNDDDFGGDDDDD